ncbi:hypothetical protein AMJ44_12955 [candidate division WOR-1 bacterium DG_54_3]|uniref:TIGR00725 family protein n=1 Tax=candidate division WOR-1 bacterium DG_54_3 TaxID=1703775 RepID=A0A0S7XQ71_UNCSA|nr:MAG: hypothetical protein AMJ44_12955 [candidate division WOR-1 bacterium DG_54_3]
MPRKKEKIFISVVGESDASQKIHKLAEEVGRLIAGAGAVLVCGGLKGVMEAAAKGAKSAGGLTVGILPGSKREEANPYIDIPVITGLGYARNKIVVKTGQVVIAIGGKYGTLSEIGFALGYGIPVVGLNTWELIRGDGKVDQGIVYVRTPEEAVQTAFKLIRKVYKPRTKEKGI